MYFLMPEVFSSELGKFQALKNPLSKAQEILLSG